MESQEITLEFMKVIAPVIVQEGIKLQNRLIEAGSDPTKCTICGKDIPHSYAESAKEWAMVFAEVWMND